MRAGSRLLHNPTAAVVRLQEPGADAAWVEEKMNRLPALVSLYARVQALPVLGNSLLPALQCHLRPDTRALAHNARGALERLRGSLFLLQRTLVLVWRCDLRVMAAHHYWTLLVLNAVLVPENRVGQVTI